MSKAKLFDRNIRFSLSSTVWYFFLHSAIRKPIYLTKSY